LTEHGSPNNYNAEETRTAPKEGFQVLEGSSIKPSKDQTLSKLLKKLIGK
jgi:hypothetical protein